MQEAGSSSNHPAMMPYEERRSMAPKANRCRRREERMKTAISRRHMKYWLMTGLLLVLILTLNGHADSAKLNGLAGPTGGPYYQYMAGLAKIVHDVYPDIRT
jgi:hypothetical protein